MFKCVKLPLIEIKINAIEPGTNSTVPKYNVNQEKSYESDKEETKKTLVTSQTGFK